MLGRTTATDVVVPHLQMTSTLISTTSVGVETAAAGAGIAVVGYAGTGKESGGSGSGGAPTTFSVGAGAGGSEGVKAGASGASGAGVAMAKAAAESDGEEMERANLAGCGDRAAAAEKLAGDECQRSKAGSRRLWPQLGQGSAYPTISLYLSLSLSRIWGASWLSLDGNGSNEEQLKSGVEGFKKKERSRGDGRWVEWSEAVSQRRTLEAVTVNIRRDIRKRLNSTYWRR